MIDQKQLESVEYFSYLGRYVKLNPGLPWDNRTQQEEYYFHQQVIHTQ